MHVQGLDGPSTANPEALTRQAAADVAAQLSGGFARPLAGGLPAPQIKGFKPAPLRLDDAGREVDEHGVLVVHAAGGATSLKVRTAVQPSQSNVAPVSVCHPHTMRCNFRRVEHEAR